MPTVVVGNSVFNMPSSSVINPGSVFQTSSGGQTTYPNAPSGFASLGSLNAPNVETPAGTPAGASVYQSNGIYAPSSAQTNFTSDPLTGMGTQSPYSQNPSLYPNIGAVPGSISNTDIKKTDKLPEAIAKSQEQLNQIAPGSKIPNVESLKGLSEKDIARTSSGDIFRRDLAAEQKALGAYIAKNGQPTTATDWLKFHDAVYKGATVPGATDLPATQQPAAPEIATDQGLIDLQKYESSLTQMLAQYNSQITQAQTNLAHFQTDTAKGVANVGDQLGRSASLVQGEQYSLKQQRQADEGLLVARLGIAQDAKGMAIETANIQMQIEQKIYDRKRDIVNDARLLRQDQQDSFASFLNLASQSGISKDSFDKGTLDLINKQSQMTGIPAQLYINALDAIYNDKLVASSKSTEDDVKYGVIGKDEYGNDMYGWINSTKQTVSSGNQTTAPSNLLTPGAIGGQCGDYLHKVADNIPTMGDLFEQKMQMANTPNGEYQVGDVLIQKTNMPYGHVSIVTAVNGNQATVTESNYNYKSAPETVGTRTITMGDKSVNGVYRGAKLKTPVENTPETLSPFKQEVASLIEQVKEGTLDPKDIKNENVKNAVQAGLVGQLTKADEANIEMLKDRYKDLEELKDNKGLTRAVGVYGVARWTPFTRDKAAVQDFVATVQNLTAKDTLKTLTDLKKAGGTLGALSEKELTMLQNAATKITNWELRGDKKQPQKVTGYEISEELFLKEVNELKRLTGLAIQRAGGSISTGSTPSGISFNVETSQSTPSGIKYEIIK